MADDTERSKSSIAVHTSSATTTNLTDDVGGDGRGSEDVHRQPLGYTPLDWPLLTLQILSTQASMRTKKWTPIKASAKIFLGVIEVLVKPSEQNIGWDFIIPSTTQRSYLFSSKVHILKKKTRIFSFPWFFLLTLHYILWRTFVIPM